MLTKRLTLLLLIPAFLLLLPLIAMLFTQQVQWHASDFAIAALLLFGASLACEAIFRSTRVASYRLTLCILIVAGVAIIWAELAVGIFGSSWAGS